MIRERMAVTALNAGCDVSSSFLPADKNSRSAPNVSAAWDFCSWFRGLRVPNQVNASRIRRHCRAQALAGVGCSAWVRFCQKCVHQELGLGVDEEESMKNRSSTKC
jgi:hypothetical protein